MAQKADPAEALELIWRFMALANSVFGMRLNEADKWRLDCCRGATTDEK